MKDTLRRLFLSTLEELALERHMPRKVVCRESVLGIGNDRIELAPFKKVLAVAIGKAAFPMAQEMSRILRPQVLSGIAVSSVPPPDTLSYFVAYQGGHPYPDGQSVHAANVVLEFLDDLKPHHLVIYLMSGGGSAICEKPVSDEISLNDLREFYRLLVTCGADIVEMNVLRKHFSATKGGRLAEQAHPARQLTLYVSDVPPDKPSTVASGPTLPDESTVGDCYEIVERLGLLESLPASIRSFFHDRCIPETPKPDSEAFQGSLWHCLLDNQDGVERLTAQVKDLGWVVEADLSVDDWPLEKAVDHLLGKLEHGKQAHPDATVAVLTGGELSCAVTGDGQGGRNQAFVLECARKIAGKNIAVVSAGTDGVDGNSPAAGAVADGSTLSRANELGMDAEDFQRRSDSYHFFKRLGDDLTMGPTGNNVRDLRLLVSS